MTPEYKIQEEERHELARQLAWHMYFIKHSKWLCREYNTSDTKSKIEYAKKEVERLKKILSEPYKPIAL